MHSLTDIDKFLPGIPN